ncbi:MAG: ABC transporter ATP-binding protein, partial [Opitutaceae bacterium]
NLSGVKEVRAFGLERIEVDRFARLARALARAQMKVVKYAQALSPSIEILSAAGISVTFVYAYRFGVHASSFLGILTALYLSYDPIKRLGAINNELKRGSASLLRLEEVLNEPEPISDPPNPAQVGRLRGDIAFEEVGFEYKPGVPVLRDLDVRIPRGTVCALVGPSGAGKTTFASLVPRFYDVTRGRLTIDGIDVRSMRLSDLRRNIALVSQDPVLFNDSLYHNLLLGRPEASREEVIAAARNAHAHEFIREFPQGYDSPAGERGSRLSGGQKQRIAIARAFLRNAPILILDEATSSLDSESEAAIQDALKHLMVGKTVLIIAHRFSTIRDASLILVFEQGAIAASGGHEALYGQDGLYRALYDRQLGQRVRA